MNTLASVILFFVSVNAAALPIVPKCAFDVAFLFDNGNSIPEANFTRGLEFASRFLREAALEENTHVGGANGTGGIFVGLIPFSEEPSLVFPLGVSKFVGAGVIDSAIRDIAYRGGSSDLAAAIEFLGTQVFRTDRGDRLEYPNLAILLSDGGSAKPETALAAAAALPNVHFASVSVGSDRNSSMLHKLSGGPVFTLSSKVSAILNSFACGR